MGKLLEIKNPLSHKGTFKVAIHHKGYKFIEVETNF